MTHAELFTLVHNLEYVFDTVRVVNASVTYECAVSQNGDISIEPYQCYAVWRKDRRCENCIAAKAFAQKGQVSKFEFVGHEVYHVVAKYVEVDGVPYVVEMISAVSDETLFGVYGKSEFTNSITAYNHRMYVDPLTNAYNRRYYEEQLSELNGVQALAILDIDDFKSINDTFGHPAGDKVLCSVAESSLSCLRTSDTIVRCGDDEFLLLFYDMPALLFHDRLEQIRYSIEQFKLPDYPEIHLSVSIGGVWDQASAEELMNRANTMLDRAKESKNQVETEINETN